MLTFNAKGFSGSYVNMRPYTIRLSELLTEAGVTHSIANYGNCGECAVNMDSRLQTIVGDGPHSAFNVMLFLGGSNDLGRSVSGNPESRSTDPTVLSEFGKVVGDRIFDGLRKLYARSRACGAHTVVMSIFEHGMEDEFPGMRAAREHVRELQRAYCAEPDNRASFFDLATAFPFFGLDPAEHVRLWNDAVHPTAAGYDRFGELVFQHMKDVGLLKTETK